MPEMQAAREALSHLLVGLHDVDDSVVRGEKKLGNQTYAVAYVDFADDVVERSLHLRDFQERILADDFFDAPGDLRWNKYLYIVAGPNSKASPQFAEAKAVIEADKDYARKRVISQEDLESQLGGPKLFEAAKHGSTYDVLTDWRQRLSAAGLELLLDAPTPRTTVVEKIAQREAGAVANGKQQVKELNAADTPLATAKLLSLNIASFRSVHNGKTYDFGDVTLLVGANGSGKTSLLEAVEYFYCGNNRRSTAVGPVRLKGKLRPGAGGNTFELSSTAEGPRIKARNLAWYNRKAQSIADIVDSFSLYNFLDTDAAYRLSGNLKPDDIKTELSRLLVGSSAATTFDYLQKIRADMDKAWDKAHRRAEGLQAELTVFEWRLKELQGKPSIAKTLTDAYRAALAGLGWNRSAEAGVPTQREGQELLAALAHVQALVSLGDAARTIKDVEHRWAHLEAAVGNAKPIDKQLVGSFEHEKRLVSKMEELEDNVKNLDRWIAYESAGFHDVRRRYKSAREVSEQLATRLGGLVAGDLPQVPQQYASLQLRDAVKAAGEAATVAHARFIRAQQALDLHGRAASARATAAAKLKDAAKEALKSLENPDMCPVCRTVHASGALMHFIEELTSGPETTREVEALAESLRLAGNEANEARSWAGAVELCQKFALQLQLGGATTPKEVLEELVGLRERTNQAQLELQRVIKEGQDLGSAGFSSKEADLVWRRISGLFETESSNLTADSVLRERLRQSNAVEETRKVLDDCRSSMGSFIEAIRGFARSVAVDDWDTRVEPIGSFASLVALQDEFLAATNNAAGLRSYLAVEDDVPLVEVQARIAAVASAFKQADEASRSDSDSSAEQRDLLKKIQGWKLSLGKHRDEEKALLDAGKVLDDLIENASLENATREALDAIGGQINEVFSRIHSPREYEYVGSPNVLLRTADGHDPRTLDEVSTGQRAAFALSIFLARNRTAGAAPPMLLIDDPIAHIDDLNALSFLDYLRDLAVNSGRQIFFATADTRVASLFSKKFSFLGESFKTIHLMRSPQVEEAAG
ncbi:MULTISPECIES: AAA family ATPase [unclassified Delftia]|uniref:AAA family ATPase n=1 Tax=unclassified Delftia TaxID=2613839 RepID=UPI0019003596|nr:MULTISPECIES: AAA family ATPase [unclassified Delftia]MBK0115806.1 AAA family ATPase [Delftia sp. S65]MBK0119370.1 AAA family ATPase [Delftia sp. S67]MBK0132187.1 AAA family ATPase [Delftia sp. S66]